MYSELEQLDVIPVMVYNLLFMVQLGQVENSRTILQDIGCFIFSIQQEMVCIIPIEYHVGAQT